MEFSIKQKYYIMEQIQYNYRKGYMNGLISGAMIGIAIGVSIFNTFDL